MINKKDKQLLEQLKTIKTIATNLISWVEEVGNFDAACDSGIDQIIEAAKTLEDIHDSIFRNTDNEYRQDIRGHLVGIGDKVVTRPAANSHAYLLIGKVIGFTKKNLVKIQLSSEDRIVEKECKTLIKL